MGIPINNTNVTHVSYSTLGNHGIWVVISWSSLLASSLGRLSITNICLVVAVLGFIRKDICRNPPKLVPVAVIFMVSVFHLRSFSTI